MCDRIKELFCKLSPEVGKKPSDSTSWLNILCFCVFGTLSFFSQEMLYTASEDILSGRKLPTATILVCFVTPLMITKIFAPWFIQKIPYFAKVSFVVLCMTLGLVLIVFVEDMRVKLSGIALNAMATGACEVTFLGLTSFYPQICISAFVAGTGMASLFAPLYYTGKRNILSLELRGFFVKYIWCYFISIIPFSSICTRLKPCLKILASECHFVIRMMFCFQELRTTGLTTAVSVVLVHTSATARKYFSLTNEKFV